MAVAIPLLSIIALLVALMLLPLLLADFPPRFLVAPVRARQAEHASHVFGSVRGCVGISIFLIFEGGGGG